MLIPKLLNLRVLLVCIGLVLALRTESVANAQTRADQGVESPQRGYEFFLQTLSGQTVPIASLWSNRPAVIMAGSYSCPVFREKLQGFEELSTAFSNEVNFAVLYVQEAHPKGEPSPYTGREWVTAQNQREGVLLSQPKTAEERLQRARLCAAALKLTVPLLIDGMDNVGWRALGGGPNSAILVTPNGQVVEREKWFDLDKMRSAIRTGLKSTSPGSIPATK